MRACRFVVATVVAALTLAANPAVRASGASMQAGQAVVMKGRAPVSNEVLEIRLPRPVHAELSNGLHLMVLEDHRVPQVSFRIVIPGAGGYYDPSGMIGLSSIVAALMREGTASRTSSQMSEQLETIAATVTVGSGASSESATVSGASLTESFETTFGIAADVLLNPSFPEDELARYKERTRANLLQLRTNPNFLASEMIGRVLYGTHPAARINVTPEALDRATVPALSEFHRTRFVPDHAVVAIAGDVTLDDARRVVDAALRTWKQSGAAEPATTDPAAAGAGHVSFVARPNSVQSSFVVGTQAVSRTSPEYDVLEVMNEVIGGGPTGRLFTILREEKGYTYGAYSGLDAPKHRGDWQASTDVRTEVTEVALRDLLFEISRLRDEPIPAREFEDKKRSMVASFALSLESPVSVLNYAMTQWTFGLPDDYWDTYPNRIAAVTQEQVQAAAKKYLDPARLQIVVVGDPTKVSDVLKKFGTVETYDTNGQRIGGGSGLEL